MAGEALSLKRMLAASWGYLAVLTLGSWVAYSWSFAWAVLAGGIISITSFLVAYRDMTALFDSVTAGREQPEAGLEKTKQSKKGFILKFWLRIVLIGVVLFLLIRWGNINVFGLILGLTTVVFTIIITALGVVWRYYFSRR